jgi:xylose isomerase
MNLCCCRDYLKRKHEILRQIGFLFDWSQRPIIPAIDSSTSEAAMSHFPNVSKIRFEGPDSTNPLAFRHYNENEIVEGKSMKEHLRFAVCYWHTFRGMGGDPFGPGCAVRPWEDGSNTHRMDLARVDVAFEFMSKLGAPYYCFHDRDISGEGDDLRETNQLLDKVVAKLKTKQQETGIKLLWGTANLFSNPRFVHGAATSCNADVFAYAAAQVKKAIEVTKELGGENYVFWGGREGYMNLYNTDLKRELDHLARFFHLAVEHKKKIGFTGQFLIEPKPKEPTTHQYDFDCAAVVAFLKSYGLADHFKLNVETNHATLAGHTMMHELAYASMHGLLGSIDANRGDLLLGWDTDQFPTDLYLTTQCMLVILGQGGLAPGGVNFDAKVRRESFEPVDLFYAHIGGMDAFAHGLKIAARMRADGVLRDIVKQRYASWDAGIGADIEGKKAGFEQLEAYILQKGDADKNVSGRQELIENIVNRYVR